MAAKSSGTNSSLSREEGEIALGFSSGVGAGVVMVSKSVIKMGKGDAVVRGRVTPKRTGTLPFGKIAVHLAEYPHRPRHSPLASDSETVEVK